VTTTLKSLGLCIAALVLALASSARASTVEPRVKLLVRDKPTATGKIVDRVPAGRRLVLISRTRDGQWAHVQGPKRDGWIPTAALKGRVTRAGIEEAPAEVPDENAVSRALAPRRSVRPETWVSQSRYHDGEDTKLTVSATKAELFGRPMAGGAVLGIVRRGEVVQLVRRSADKKWILVDVGGGESAWLEARMTKPGVVQTNVMPGNSTATPAERAATAREEINKPEQPKEDRIVTREPSATPATVQSTPRATKMVDSNPPSAEPAMARNDEEAPPLGAADKQDDKPGMRKKKVVLASSDPSAVGMTAADRSALEADSSVAASALPHGNNYFSVGAKAGVAIINQRFTSNGSGSLANYDASSAALGAQVGLGYQRGIGRYFRLGLDGEYAFAGAAAFKYKAADGSNVTLGVQDHTIDAGASAGLHFNVIGGLDLGLRLGGELALNLIQATTKAPLPSDRVLGLTIGLGMALPAFATIADRPLGAHVVAMGLVPAQRVQTPGLEEGPSSSTVGFGVAAGLAYNLVKGLYMNFDYSYGLVLTHFEGQARRNTTITAADRGNEQHLIVLGLSYNL
jgi:opacity protein-like surface antigen